MKEMEMIFSLVNNRGLINAQEGSMIDSVLLVEE
jgi:hypothetical protein